MPLRTIKIFRAAVPQRQYVRRPGSGIPCLARKFMSALSTSIANRAFIRVPAGKAVASAKSEKRQYRDHNDDEAYDVDYLVHYNLLPH